MYASKAHMKTKSGSTYITSFTKWIQATRQL